MRRQYTKVTGPAKKKKKDRPETLTHDMVRELQVLRKERETLEHERDNALESEQQVKSKACSTVREYKQRFDRLIDFVRIRAPEVLEQWKQEEETRTRS